MTNQEILEGNKLIAEFMEAKMIVENYHGINIIKFPDGQTHDLAGLRYHSLWDWLMPVVQKVTKLIQDKQYIPIGKYQEYKEQYDIYEEQWRKLFDYRAYNFFKADIESIYKAIISFIEWYNHNIKNT